MVRAFKAFVGIGLLCGASGAHAEWRKFETAHFIIFSESNDKRVEELATGLERTDGLMRMATGLPTDGQTVKVRIYELADEGGVEAALGLHNSGIAGFYTSNVLGPYAVTVRKAYSAEGDFTAELVLHHEYAHHFMLQYFPGTYPPWYVEGFAELIGASKTLPDGRIAYGYPAKYRRDIYWADMRDILLKPAEKVSFDLYGQGWAMTHFLTFSKKRSPQLRQYLSALNAGRTPAEAASAFGDLAELNREGHAYLLSGSFEYRPVNVPIHQPVIERVSPVGAAEAELIPETIAFNDDDLSSYRKAEEREREQKRRDQVISHVRSKAARFPNDPYALFLLAQVEDKAGNKQVAAAATDRLLTVQPSHVGGMVLKSMLMSDAAMRSAGDARAAKAVEARHLAMDANKADPDNPLTYVAFYKSFLAAGVSPPAPAVDGLAAAVEKLPSNTGVRQMLVDEFAKEGRFGDAIATLAPIANDPHESPMRQAAREKVEKLKAQASAKPGTVATKS
jgi:tetratricopeptide (TPR) repeat protein